MFENPLVIYSNYCAHSNKFMTLLRNENGELWNAFDKLCIDADKQTKQRPQIFFKIQKQLNVKITEVPTIIVNQGAYVLPGEEAFKWLEWYLSQSMSGEPAAPSEREEILEAFNPNEMGSFSDSYSRIGSTTLNDATDQSFHFLNKPSSSIYTPPETETAKPDDLNRKQKEREAFSNTPTPRQSVSNSNITNWKSNNDQKYQDVDKKLEQLMAERERQL
jgi:hypothetical protein